MIKRRLIFKWSLALGALLFCTVGLIAQRTITGQMTDAGTGEPLIGANVVVQGTTTGTVTDFDGMYSIDASEGAVLEFSYTGYSTQQITVGAANVIDVALESGQILDEVVVVAYGKQKKVTVTGAVVGVQGEQLKQSPAVDIS
ncbi:MAG: carboxypeptidase-like regulatory domain-containing protein, partial [Saprospiraceae bacterium]